MRSRLVLVAAATTAMVALAFVVPLGLLVRSVASERALADARQATQIVVPSLAVGDVAAVEVARSAADARVPGVISVVLPDGDVVGPPVRDRDGVARAVAGTAVTVDDASGLAVHTPVFTRAGDVAVVLVTVPRDELTRGVARAWAVLAALGLALVGGAVLLADRLGTTIVRPVRRTADVARSLADGDLEARVDPTGPPEVAEVARALNGLATRIRHLLAAEREAAADLSHRLRTPLTAVRVEAGALPASPARTRLEDALGALERQIDRVIRETREPRSSVRGHVDLVALVRDHVAFWTPLAEEEAREVAVDVPERAVVGASEDGLADALDALIGNVLAHTPEGTACRVAVGVVAQRVSLVVEDDGPGFDPAVVERGVSAAGSTGLGLDIARRVARDAGGRLRVGAREGGGARVELELPLSDAIPDGELSPA